jgi:hypothetical protein
LSSPALLSSAWSTSSIGTGPSCEAGLDRLSELGEIANQGNWHFKIIDKNPAGAATDRAIEEPVPDPADP